MCGLFGFSRTTEVTRRMTPTLAIAMNSRGSDSWGVTDGITIHKDAFAIVDSFVDCELDGPAYHTRGASVGSISEKNAHPFHFEDKYIITGMHNGHINNHAALKDKYKHRKDDEVDSEQIFRQLAEYKPVSELSGYGAVVWYEQPASKKTPMVRYFSRWNTTDLYFARMVTGEIVYASTKTSIELAAMLAGAEIDKHYDTEAKRRYFIKRDGDGKGQDALWYDLQLPWAEKPVTITISTPSYPYQQHEHRHNAASLPGKDDCPVVEWACMGKVKPGELICSDCLAKLRKQYGFGATA